jgi:hypothetical protein
MHEATIDTPSQPHTPSLRALSEAIHLGGKKEKRSEKKFSFIISFVPTRRWIASLRARNDALGYGATQ